MKSCYYFLIDIVQNLFQLFHDWFFMRKVRRRIIVTISLITEQFSVSIYRVVIYELE